eukprot:scaffold120828_cov21-Phaeocystis_antarctica.AAC.1
MVPKLLVPADRRHTRRRGRARCSPGVVSVLIMTCAPRAATKQPRLGTHIYTYIHIYAYLEEPRLECLVDDDVVPGEGVRGR